MIFIKVLIQRIQQGRSELHIEPQGFPHGADLHLAGMRDQLFVGTAFERRKNQMLISQPRHLLGPKAPSKRLLDVDARQPLRERVEHVGIGVAVLHALGHALVHLV